MPTNKDRPRIHHFHAYNRVRLTIYTLPVKGKETWYAVGMALCHKKDNGSRIEGRELAKISAEIAQRDFEPHFPQGFYEILEPGICIFKSASLLKDLIVSLRKIEHYCTDCKALSFYNQVFRGNLNPIFYFAHLTESEPQ
jgi:hypothetical protein